LVIAEILKFEKTSLKRILDRNRPLFPFYCPFVAKMTAEFFFFFFSRDFGVSFDLVFGHIGRIITGDLILKALISGQRI
jgi:hypothetical protein